MHLPAGFYDIYKDYYSLFYHIVLFFSQFPLKSQADVNTQDINGSTALHLSASAGHLTITELLLAAEGDTAADVALDYHHRKVYCLLRMHKKTKPHPPPENVAGDKGPTITYLMDKLQFGGILDHH